MAYVSTVITLWYLQFRTQPKVKHSQMLQNTLHLSYVKNNWNIYKPIHLVNMGLTIIEWTTSDQYPHTPAIVHY